MEDIVDIGSEVQGLSKRDVEDFLLNPVWKRLKEHVEGRLRRTTDQMRMAPPEDIWGKDEEGRSVLEVTCIKRLQGMAVEDDVLLELPQSYLDELSLISELKDKENE